MITNRQQRRSSCPINASLEVLGDRWSLLIVRDMLFGGARTYKDFQASDESIATNVLADRLTKLQDAGIITSERNPEDGRSHIYRLTPKGIDLVPVLMELSAWGTRYEEGQPPRGILSAWQADRDGYVAEIKRTAERR
jgi:DNA-binding HxlR family transcriptional regulator